MRLRRGGGGLKVLVSHELVTFMSAAGAEVPKPLTPKPETLN